MSNRRPSSSRKSAPGRKNAHSPQAKAPLWKQVVSMFKSEDKVSLPTRKHSLANRRLGMERLEDRVVLATDITIIDAASGGTLDAFLTDGTPGVITTADGGVADGTISRGALSAVPANVNISISALDDINFDNMAGDAIPLLTGVGFSASFIADADQSGGGDLTFDSATVDVLSTAGGAIVLTATGTSDYASLNSAGGDITLTTEVITMDGAVDAGAGIVTLKPFFATTDIDLGTNAGGGFDLSDGELDNVTASVLRIGASFAGIDITVTADIDQPATWNTLSLIGNNITSDAGDSLFLSNLRISALGSVTLDDGTNVNVLAASVGGGLDLDFEDISGVTGLVIGTVDGVSGLSAPGVNGDIILNVVGTITQTAGADIITEGLTIISTGAVTLTNPGNDVDIIAATLTGAGAALQYTDADGLTVGDPLAGEDGITTNNGNVTIITNGNLVIADEQGGADIAAGSGIVFLNAVSGVGQDFSITLNANAGITGTGGVTLQADGQTINAAINAGAATVRLDTHDIATAISLGGASAAGVLGLTDAEIDFVTTTGVLIIGNTANTGDVTFNGAINGLNIAQIEIETGGSILDNNGGNDLTETRVGLTAGTGIGSGDDLQITADNFEATTNTGGILISELNAVAIGGVNGTLAGISAAGGTIDITAGSTITINEPVVNTGGGDIILETTSDDILVNAAITATGGSGSVSLTAEDDVNVTAAISVEGTGNVTIVAEPGGGFGFFTLTAGGSITSVDGTIDISAADDITIAGASASDVEATGSGGIQLTTTFGDVLIGSAGVGGEAFTMGAGPATIDAADDVVVDFGSFFGSNGVGVVTVSSGGDTTVQGANSAIYNSNPGGGPVNINVGGIFTTVAGAFGVVTDGGAVTISADDMVIGAPIDTFFNGTTGPGIVTLQQASAAARVIDLGTNTAGELGLTAAEINLVTASILRIGRADNPGDIDITDTITPTGTTVVSLRTGGSVDDDILGVVTNIAVTSLAINAGDGIGAGDALDLVVSNLAFNNLAGAINIDNTGALTIDAVDDLATSNNLGTTTTITAASPLTFAVNTFSAGNATFTAGEIDDDPVWADDLSINAGVTVSSGADLTLRAGDDINVPVGATASAVGALTLFAGFNDLDNQGNLNLGGTLIGNPINLIVFGDFVVGFIDAGTSALTITSITGAVLDGNDSVLANPNGTLNIIAGSLAIQAVTGIGRADAGLGIVAGADAELETQLDLGAGAGDIAAFTDDGGIGISNALGVAGGLTLNVENLPNFFGNVDGVRDAGNVVLTNNGTINIIAAPVTADSGANPALGNITITANGVNSDINTAGNQAAVTNNAGGVNSVFGSVTLTAERDVNLGSAALGFGDVFSANDLTINAGDDITITRNTFAESNDADGTPGNIVMTASSPLTPTNVPGGNISLLNGGVAGSRISANGAGSIILQTGEFAGAGTGVFTATAGGAGVRTLGGGDITINADDVVITDPINAGFAGGIVTVRQAGTTSRDVRIGTGTSGLGQLGISNAELGVMTGSVVRIGRLDNPGNMVVDGDITPHAGYNTLTLINGGGSLTQTAGSTIQVVNLGIRSVNTVTLNDANDVTNLAAVLTVNNGQKISFNDVSDLTVGTVDGIVGVTTVNGDVTLVAAGASLNVNQAVTAGTGIVRLVAADSITQNAAGIITAAALGARTTNNNIALGIANNDVDTFAANTVGGTVTFLDIDNLIIGSVTGDPLFTATSGITAVNGGNITVQAGTVATHTLAVNQAINSVGGTVRLSAGDAISQTAPGIITATALGAISVTSSVNLVTLANDVDTFAAQALAGSVGYADSDGVEIGAVAAAPLFAGAAGINALGTTRIQAGGSVTQTAAGIILSDLLGVNVTGAASVVALGTAANDVNTFAAGTEGGSVTFVDTDGLIVGSVGLLGLFPLTTGIVTTNSGGAGGDVTIQTGTTLALNNAVNAGAGDVRFSAGGTISQLAAGVITADELGARTTAGNIALGTAANDVNTFAAATAGGKVTLRDVDDLIIGAVAANAPFFVATAGITTANGDVTIQTGTTLTVNEDVNATAGGTVRFSAGGTVTQAATAEITGLALGVRTTAGNIDLDNAANNVGTFAAATAGGTVDYFDADALVVGTVSADAPFFAETIGILSAGGAVTVSLGAGANLTVLNPIISGGGNITLNADAMAIAAAVNAGAGIATLRQSGLLAARDIDLGSENAARLSLTDGELDLVTAAVLRIGRTDNTGNIFLTNTISPAGTTVLHLLTGGSIIDATAGEQPDIVETNLALEAATGVGSADDIDVQLTGNLAASNTTAGNIIVTNTGALTLFPVDGIAGANSVTNTAANGQVIITAASPLTVNANVVSAGNVLLIAGASANAVADNLTVSPGVSVTSATGSVTLRAGDKVLLPAGSTINAFTDITIEGGFNEIDGTDANVGGVEIGVQAVQPAGPITAGGTLIAGGAVNINGGAGSDLFIINPTAAPPVLNLFGNAGNDTFRVTPKVATAYEIDGGSPVFPTFPGDTLFVDLSEVGNNFVFTPGPAVGEGTFTFPFAGFLRQPIHFTSIETVANLFDFGDALTSYENGDPARHQLVNGLFLGAGVSADNGPKPSAAANLDTFDDGIVFLAGNWINNLPVGITATASGAGILDGWVDWNNDGDFGDAGEKVLDGVAVVAGANGFSFVVPNGAAAGTHVSRFRISTAGVALPNGLAADGEVEDHITPASINVGPGPAIVVLPDGQVVVAGTDLRDVINFTIRKIGGVPFLRATIKSTGNPLVVVEEPLANVTSIAAFGLGGNDSINVSQAITLNATLLGGDGRDVIKSGGGNDLIRGGEGNDTLRGGGGTDILLGEGGNDNLDGGSGRDISIGGTGVDRISNYSSEDILTGNNTAFDNNDVALRALMAEWNANQSFEGRVDTIRDAIAPLPGINAATSLDSPRSGAGFDASVDVIYSSAVTRDWFLDFSFVDKKRAKLDGFIGGDALN